MLDTHIKQLNVILLSGHFYSLSTSHCILLLFCFSLINKCSSQITTPLTTFTVTSSGNMPEASGLIPGYDDVNHGIWLIDGGGSEVFYFDIATQTFIDDSNNYLSFSTAPAIYGQAYTQIGNLLYFAFNNKLQVFHLTSGQITNAITFNSYFRDIAGPCLANDGRYIFLVSGMDESETNSPPSTKFMIYDTVGYGWTQGRSLQTAVRQSACNIINNYLYLYGGSDFNGIAVTKVPRIYIGNMASIATVNWDNSWETMQGNWYNHRTVVVDDIVYLIGGKVIGENPDKSIQIMNADGNMQLSSVRIKSGRSAPGVIAVNHIIYVFGGADTGVIYDTWEYSNALALPTKHPTRNPTHNPTHNPTRNPTRTPTHNNPTPSPTNYPSQNPSNNPSQTPSKNPSQSPSNIPSKNPSQSPSKSPSNTPSENPTQRPTITPSNNPTMTPTFNPTHHPTLLPTNAPSSIPTYNPTLIPSIPTLTNYPTITPSSGLTTAYPTNIPSQHSTTTSGEVTGYVAPTHASQEKISTNSTYFVIAVVILSLIILMIILLSYLCCVWQRIKLDNFKQKNDNIVGMTTHIENTQMCVIRKDLTLPPKVPEVAVTNYFHAEGMDNVDINNAYDGGEVSHDHNYEPNIYGIEAMYDNKYKYKDTCTYCDGDGDDESGDELYVDHNIKNSENDEMEEMYGGKCNNYNMETETQEKHSKGNTFVLKGAKQLSVASNSIISESGHV